MPAWGDESSEELPVKKTKHMHKQRKPSSDALVKQIRTQREKLNKLEDDYNKAAEKYHAKGRVIGKEREEFERLTNALTLALKEGR